MIESLLSRGDRLFRIPRWAWLPALLGLGDLTLAGFGFYWDVSWHIEKGRDKFLFTPPHVLILVGLIGVGVLGLLAHYLYTEAGETWGFRILGRTVAPGALLLVTCGAFAGVGFPLDDIWHAMFGQDVTLWGPTHMLMVSGAALSPLGFAMLLSHGLRERGEPPNVATRILALNVASVMLVGLSAYQAEFDFGVPQFQMLFQPLLVAAAAGLVLLTVRLALGRGAALIAVVLYALERLVISGALAGLGRGVPRFPWYVGAALVVEIVGVAFRGRRALQVVAGGLAIGTVGVLAEAGVMELWGKHPWSPHALAWGIGLGIVVALGAATIALAIAGGLRPELP
ncbi:MAG TPA: hypothetical protein VKA30_10440, partial [Actinomycetota bacterium]|nr:hypothetical protein [Actinomycetota bacterium]